jgi:hypothetical protein
MPDWARYIVHRRGFPELLSGFPHEFSCVNRVQLGKSLSNQSLARAIELAQLVQKKARPPEKEPDFTY